MQIFRRHNANGIMPFAVCYYSILRLCHLPLCHLHYAAWKKSAMHTVQGSIDRTTLIHTNTYDLYILAWIISILWWWQWQKENLSFESNFSFGWPIHGKVSHTKWLKHQWSKHLREGSGWIDIQEYTHNYMTSWLKRKKPHKKLSFYHKELAPGAQ